ncbi:PREDICTED: putative disease resistance protein RGA4 [Fragaria vesca subsp. vesca]|uniref:putative disease resistance protein RGA4 n=1 Tax=Fragaria vesca subsp. vesca TaxID=101020 RepID=UPI0002C2FC43|nr:PREDICTED: putative disease resistance protein RGA4 [Fragaria vesca subsp. vesca]
MAEALVGVLVERLVSITLDKVGQELNLVIGVDKEIENLTLSLRKIEALLEDAEQRQVQDGSVRVWLSNLKEVSDAIEEVLDEWRYEILKQQFSEKQRGEEGSDHQNAPVHVSKKQQVCFPIPSPCCSTSGVNRVVRHHGIARKIIDLSERVASIAAEGKTFQLQDFQSRPEGPEQRIKIQETSSIPDVSFGRECEKESLVSKLLNDDVDEQNRIPHIPNESSEEQDSVEESLLSINPTVPSVIPIDDGDEQNIIPHIPNESSEEQDSVEVSLIFSINPTVPSIILIVGMGGIGKTTLSQLVYDDRRVKAHFDRRIWVCVPFPFEEIQILAAIAQDLGIPYHPKENALETYSRFIFDSITKEKTKFLIVLDGVWKPKEEKWNQVIKPLRVGAKGSKILVTTRIEKTAYMMRAGNNIIHLKMLSEQNCEELFFHFAGMDRRETKEPKMLEVGKEIVRKCRGLPLAAKTLGSLMHSKQTLKEWEDVKNSSIWKLKEFEQSVFQPLLLSYYDLAPTIRKCFLYCAIFPKDYLIDKFELIYLWMAQGYLCAKEETEEYMVGEEYFDDLIMRSLFEDFERDDKRNITGCKMHDSVREFLQYLSKSEFLVMDVRRSKFKPPNEKVRHMFLTFDSVTCTSVYFPITNLRTVIMDGEWVFGLKDLFKLKSLRALDLSKYWGVIPYDIGGLIHLRYLKLSHNPSKELPETLCDLYYLQTLILDSCHLLEKLPHGMEKLVNLKHLDVRGCVSLDISAVEKLAVMRTLWKT